MGHGSASSWIAARGADPTEGHVPAEDMRATTRLHLGPEIPG